MRKTNRNPQRSANRLPSESSPTYSRELEIRLGDLGLSEREARLYAAMLSKPDCTTIELQRMADISRTKIYEILDRMIERKLCVERQVGRAKRYTPVDPKILVGWRTQQMAAQLSEIQKLEHDLSGLYEARDRSTGTLEYLETLQTPQQIKERVEYLVNKCHSELLAFIRLPFTIQSDTEADDQTIRSLQRIKVVRSVYEFGVTLLPDWKEVKKSITRWHEAGEDSRFIHKLPTKLVVFDGLHVLLMIQDALGAGQEASILFSNRELAQAFRTLFEYVWDEAIPFEQFMPRHEEIVTEYLLRRT
jgi:sugar-specific transcriptional regulator TrmB